MHPPLRRFGGRRESLHDLPNANIVMMKAHNWIRRTISKLEDLEDQEGKATGTDG